MNSCASQGVDPGWNFVSERHNSCPVHPLFQGQEHITCPFLGCSLVSRRTQPAKLGSESGQSHASFHSPSIYREEFQVTKPSSHLQSQTQSEKPLLSPAGRWGWAATYSPPCPEKTQGLCAFLLCIYEVKTFCTLQ